MKGYTVERPHELYTHPHPHPERTAYRGVEDFARGFAVRCQIWTSRGAMLQAIRMQAQRAPSSLDWKPLIREYRHERPHYEQALADKIGLDREATNAPR